jgi:hypothetical protein
MPDPSFTDDLDYDEEAPAQPNPVRDAREAAKRAKAELAETKKALEELQAFKVEAEKAQRLSSVEQAFAQFEQPASAAKYFPADMEPTKENVAEYLRDFGINVLSADDEEASSQEAPDFAPVTLGGPSPRKRLSYEDYQKLLDTEPAQAMKAMAENRVDGLMRTPRT